MKNKTTYFKQLNKILKNYKRAIPCLLIDLDILDGNIHLLQQTLFNKKAYRIVVKSLPSVELINYVMEKALTKKLMVFHQPFLSHLSEYVYPDVDILLGKPLPVQTVAYYYQQLHSKFNPEKQIQWLADSHQRTNQYLGMAISMQLKMRINIELDVGLHRGGIDNLNDLKKTLQLIQQSPDHLEFSGFMGYDPHIPKLPNWLISQKKAFEKANTFYTNCINLVKNEFNMLWNDQLTFNGSGSPTFHLHVQNNSVLNEVAVGSCLLKPTDFDMKALQQYKPCCFIATPILKKFKDTRLPGIQKLKGVLSIFNKNFRQSFFTYGGYWKANYCYPPALNENSIFRSTNQTMLTTSSKTQLDVDDFVFLRPQQSEFVLPLNLFVPLRSTKRIPLQSGLDLKFLCFEEKKVSLENKKMSTTLINLSLFFTFTKHINLIDESLRFYILHTA